MHNGLAELSCQCHEKASQYLSHSAPTENLTAHSLGRLRLDIKKSITKELQEIDKLVKKLLKS